MIKDVKEMRQRAEDEWFKTNDKDFEGRLLWFIFTLLAFERTLIT